MAKPVILKFPAGIDQRSREYALAEGAGRTLTNLDITKDGGVICRKGLRRLIAGDCHSLYAPTHGHFSLLVRNSELCRLSADRALTPLVTVSGSVAYAAMDQIIYWSDGEKSGAINPTGEAGNWGLATPVLPLCEPVVDGGLTAGRYQIAMTAILDSTGLESGAAEPASIEVSEGGGIQVTTPAASGVHFAIYLTPVSGERHELRQLALLPPSTTATLGVGNPGKPLESLFAVKPPPAHCLAVYKGRLWIASGSVVWFTPEKSPHWVFPSEGYFLFESAITMLGAAENGIYIGLADGVYFLEGNSPQQMTRRMTSRIGALPGGGNPLPPDVFLGQGEAPSIQCAWWDALGRFSVGKSGGVIMTPTQDRYAAGFSACATGSYRAYEGLRQWISVLLQESPNPSPLSATDTTIRQIFQNGVPL